MHTHWEDLTRSHHGPARQTRAPLRVAVLSSHRAPGLAHLLTKDPHRGTLYDVVCCLTSEEAFAERALAAAYGMPVLTHPIRPFCLTRGRRVGDLTARAAYDAATVERLAPYRPDLIVLASYLYVLTEPMLAAFPHRIINVHHSDLTQRGALGHPRFIGLRAVRDAILAGETETRATVHLVTSELDAGPPFLRSWPFPVSPLASAALRWQADDISKAYSYAHQEWMIRATWGPLLSASVELIANARLRLPALARMAPGGNRSPWVLDASGAIHGEGPLQSIRVPRLVAAG